MSARKANWGDEDDEGEREYETRVDANGQKLRVRTKTNSKGQTVRVTSTIKVSEIKVRVPKRVLARRNLPRFGDAVEGEANVTLPSKDYIMMEHPDDALVEDAEDNTINTLASFIAKQQERALEREHDLGDYDDEDLEKAAATAAGMTDGAASGGADDVPSSSAGGKYVPPGARGGPGGVRAAFGGAGGPGENREAENTLRVSNLTKAVTEDDLRELFCRYGRISRISLPKIERKDEAGNIYKEPKGFAYIAFMDRADAEVAMNELNGHGYDHLILKIEWARAPDAASMSARSGLSGGFVSGYGERLAQDTKEKVSFASNLSENK